MTKGELVKALENYADDVEVRIHSPARDYWRNQLALEVRSADVAKVVYSDYHEEQKVLEEDDEDFGTESCREDCREVILLSNWLEV